MAMKKSIVVPCLAISAASAGLIGHWAPEVLSAITDSSAERDVQDQFSDYITEHPDLPIEYEQTDSLGGSAVRLFVRLQPERIDPLPEDVAERVRDAVVEVRGNDGVYESRGSGFLIQNALTGETEVMTAGHVLEEVHGPTIEVVTNNHQYLPAESASSYFVQEEDFIEDMAVINLEPNALQLDDVALQGRDLAAEPLAMGEPVYLVNYQGEIHEPGNPAEYAMIAGGRQSTGAQILLGDVVPGVEEDSLSQGGGSGGVVVDEQGRAVGISNASFEKRPCDIDILLNSPGFPEDTKAYLSFPEDLDECNDGDGLEHGRMRPIDAGGVFVPSPRVTPDTFDISR